MKKLIILFLTILSTLTLTLKAEIVLPAIFGDHMVLQQKTEVAIWGKATPGNIVNINTSWNGSSYDIRSDSGGSWRIKVKTPPAGGPYDITISDGEELKLSNVLIGEVWLVSGQSNMAMPMKGYRNEPITGSNEAIATSKNDYIRLFTVSREKSLNTLDDVTGRWQECLPGNVAEFSATAYFFGKMVQKALGVPVGLINSSWGGTRIEPWISEDGIKKFDRLTPPDKKQTGDFSHQTPTVLFNGMISPLTGFSIKGALWYQGESNCSEHEHYTELMLGLIENWRAEWKNDDMPFYYVQIAPFAYRTNGLNSAFLREAQLNASNVLPNTGMASLMDAGEENSIHPADKKSAGERLAYLALAKTYGKEGFEYSGPVLKNMTIEGNMVKLTFNHAKNGLTIFGRELENFKIAGENRRFYKAEGYINREGVILYSPRVNNPVAVRYAFEDFVIGELYNTGGLPASSFRTDDWE